MAEVISENVAQIEPKVDSTTETKVSSFGKIREGKFDINDYKENEVLTAEEESLIKDEKNIDKDTAVKAGTAATLAKEGEGEQIASPVPVTPEEIVPNAEIPVVPEFTEAQMKAFFEKNGILIDSLDALKEKLSPKDISPEEKKKQELAAEKKLVDIFVNGGGTVEQYVGLKDVSNKTLPEFSRDNLIFDLQKKGLNEEEVNGIMKDSFYQLTNEELGELEDDDEYKAQISKKRDAMSLVLDNYAITKHEQAKQILADLKSAADSDRLSKEQEVQFSSKIDEHFNKVPRKITFDLGESNGKAISPIEYEVSESDVSYVKDLLKDQTKRQQFLTNEDGELNIPNLAEVLIQNKYLKKAIKLSFLEGQSRATAIFDNNYPKNPYDIGIGGASNKSKFVKGQVAGFGKMRVR